MESLYLSGLGSSDDLMKSIPQSKISLENFTLLKMIGKGSYSKVALVRKKDTNKIYALKILKKSCIKQKKQISHIKEERSILVLKF